MQRVILDTWQMPRLTYLLTKMKTAANGADVPGLQCLKRVSQDEMNWRMNYEYI